MIDLKTLIREASKNCGGMAQLARAIEADRTNLFGKLGQDEPKIFHTHFVRLLEKAGYKIVKDQSSQEQKQA